VDYVPYATPESVGLRQAKLIFNLAAGPRALHQRLERETREAFRNHSMQPEILAIVKDAPIASLSVEYSYAGPEKLNLQIYPMLQRYAAYTPYLDQRNAGWLRERGPRYLLFDGKTIDSRHFWIETPATWLEVYRWYDTRLLTTRNLLLERRARPRFQSLVRVSSLRTPDSAPGSPRVLSIPAIPEPLFWTMDCHLTAEGKLMKTIMSVPEVTLALNQSTHRPFRVIMEMLAEPVPANFLPENLKALADLLGPAPPALSVRSLTLAGPGLDYYTSGCSVEYQRLVQ
jgi:hypothetical protein